MMERNALTNATAQGRLSENCVDQARRINPVVNPVGHVNIAAGYVKSDLATAAYIQRCHNTHLMLGIGLLCQTSSLTTYLQIWPSTASPQVAYIFP